VHVRDADERTTPVKCGEGDPGDGSDSESISPFFRASVLSEFDGGTLFGDAYAFLR